MKLRTKFGAILLVVTLLLSGAVYGGLEYYEGQTRERTEQNVDETTRLAAQQIESSLAERMDYVGLVASRPEAADFDRSEQYLDGILDSTRFFAAQVVDANGTVHSFRGAIEQSTRQETVDEDVSDQPYFSQAVIQGVHVTEPQYVEGVDRYIVVISAPIFERGEVAGVLAASIYVTDETFFNSIVPVDTGSRSVVVSHGDATLYRSDQTFEQGIQASAVVEPVDWRLTVTRDQSVLNDQLRGLAIAQGLGLFVVLFSVVSFGLWEYRENLQQTRRLLDGFSDLQSGEYDSELDLSNSQEWMEIEAGFDELSAGLARRETEIRKRGQRLEVLNRVLRHNLRNDMSIVVNSAELVQEFTDDDRAASAADNVATVGRRLVDTGEKARQLESVLADTEPRQVDLVSVVDDVVDDLRDEHPAATVRMDVPEEATVTAVPGVAFAVKMLGENGLLHNDRDHPTVEFVIDRVDGPDSAVTFSIVDDGPGVPEHELEVLDSGSETPLEHGSGLGLWTASWVADASGADLSFDASDDGTTATLRFPLDADGPATDAESVL